ncbi:MAG: alpha/beta hydrolase, partial [Crocinitomicaceae bacterium]|nr:alpha/beta hydrolase [Crocinitomicaceae bacterium]
MAKGLHYELFGEGPITIFLHGFLESSTMWETLNLTELPGTKLLIDLPGHGKSSLSDPSEIPSMKFMADEVGRVISKINPTQYSIVGHSMGGYVALELFANTPKGISKPSHVTLLNSNCWSDSEAKQADRLRVARIAYTGKELFINEAIPNLFARPEEFQKEIASLKQEAKAMSSDAIAYAALAMRARVDYTELVLNNSACFKIIHGALDRLVGVEELIARLTPPAEQITPALIVIPNAGHMAHWEATEEVVKG